MIFKLLKIQKRIVAAATIRENRILFFCLCVCFFLYVTPLAIFPPYSFIWHPRVPLKNLMKYVQRKLTHYSICEKLFAKWCMKVSFQKRLLIKVERAKEKKNVGKLLKN